MKIDHEGTFKGCESGKNTKNQFSKSETNTKGTLELIHFDVCGPIPSTYLSGYEYYVTFIDDYSRNTCVSTMFKFLNYGLEGFENDPVW